MVTGKQRLRQLERTEESSYSPQKVNEKPATAEELTIQDDPEEVGPIDDEEEDVGILGEMDLYNAQDIAIVNGDGAYVCDGEEPEDEDSNQDVEEQDEEFEEEGEEESDVGDDPPRTNNQKKTTSPEKKKEIPSTATSQN